MAAISVLISPGGASFSRLSRRSHKTECKVSNFFRHGQIFAEKNPELLDFTTALSFKISHTIPKYPYFIGDIPPILPRQS
jgi:hypothetical protein